MPGRRIGRVGQLKLWSAVWGVWQALQLSFPEQGLPGRGRASSYHHVCQDERCTARVFRSRYSESRECPGGHATLAVVAGRDVPRPVTSAGLFIYACLTCLGAPVRRLEEGSPVCDQHRPPRPMTLLARPQK
ncbi:hypothetical protein GCM10010378_13100 [Streptomyces viridochromogenes]